MFSEIHYFESRSLHLDCDPSLGLKPGECDEASSSDERTCTLDCCKQDIHRSPRLRQYRYNYLPRGMTQRESFQGLYGLI